MSLPISVRALSRIVLACLLGGGVIALFSLISPSGGRSGASASERLAISFLSGILYVAVLAPLGLKLPARRWTRFASILVPLYVTGTLTDLIEAYFFTSLLTPATLVGALVFGAIPAVLIAVIVAAVIPAAAKAASAGLQQRSLGSWAWRLLLAAVLYVPAYYGFSALVAPIEHPFYSDPTFVAQLQTRTPPDAVIVPLEIVRGGLFALALLPVLAVVPGERWSTFVYLALIGVVLEAIVPLLGLSSWPLAMRLGNFAELTGDAMARAAAVLALLASPPLIRRDDWRLVPAPRSQ